MNRKILTKIKMVAPVALAGVFALAGAGMALAGPPSPETQGRQGLFGTVTASDESSLTVSTRQGETLKLAVTGDTRFQASGKVGAGEVAVGSRVAVLVEENAGGITALKVMQVPGQPQGEHRVLTVVDVSGKTIIAEDAQGNRVEVELDHEVSSDIKGMLITFIGTKSEQSNRFKAKAEVKVEHVAKRLEAGAKKLDAETRAEARDEIRVKKERDLAELKARLDAILQRQLDLFDEIIATAPEQAKLALEQARERMKLGFQAALEALGKSRSEAEARLKLRNLHGTVESVNAQTGEIVLLAKGDSRVTIKVTADTKIWVGENAGTLADIVAGAEVNARYNGETLVATETRVKTEAEVEGTVQSVDIPGGKLVLALAGGTTLTLNLTPNTLIEINDKKATTAELKAGQVVEVEYDIKTLDATSIEAETTAEVEGVIKAIDTVAGTVTILTEEGKEVTVKVVSTTRVKIQGLLFGILGLSAGMEVEARYDLATGEAAEIKAEVEDEDESESKGRLVAEVHGTVQSVDAVQKKLVIKLRDGSTQELVINDQTVVRIEGQASLLADLKPGMGVEVQYRSDTGVALRIVTPGKLENETHGRVQSVDTANHKLVLELLRGGTLELTLTADTVIRINGRTSAETDLMAGMVVEVRYRADTGTALRINATGRVGVSIRGLGSIKTVDERDRD